MFCLALSLPSDLNRAAPSVDVNVRVGSRRETALEKVSERLKDIPDVVRLLRSP